MELSYVISQLESNSKAIANLLDNVPPEQSIWKPENKWSLLEIINHLCDEEREDFRQRLQLTLEDPLKEWPPIDPVGWVTTRNYNERDLSESLADFLKEREISLEWLKSLKYPNWMNCYKHPEIGDMSASKILYNWLAHDYLHLRQIIRTHFLYLEENVYPISLSYAGKW